MARAADDLKTALRKKLLRRLIWKVPLIILFVSFAVWWEWRKEHQGPTRIESISTAFTGSWSGAVTYGWGAKHIERFFFQPEGNKLFGTAGFLGMKRGIEEGKIEDQSIFFYIRYEEVSGGESRHRKNYYSGNLNGEEILMRMQDDRGNPPVEWVLRRIHQPQ